jgi:hypothetical protein
VPLGDSLTVRSYADIPDLDFLDLFGNHKKRSSAFVALKVDIIDVVTYLLFYLFIFITIFCYAFHKLHCVPLLSTMHHHVRYFTFLCMFRTHFISWFWFLIFLIFSLSSKGDMYLEGLRTFIPGCFIDCAVSNSVGVSDDSLPVTVLEKSMGVGLSLRYC